MTKQIYKYSHSSAKTFKGSTRFEHWYVSNQVYFITARCRGRYPAFDSEEAKQIFWNRFDYYTAQCLFTPWISTLMNNHYHILGYCKDGSLMGKMMQRIHGSVAKLVNDILPERQVPFWSEQGHQDYFDGCIRNEKQCRLAFRYILGQSVRHGICRDWRAYSHTRMNVELERGVKRALELGAFMKSVPYKRYMKPPSRKHGLLPR